MASRTLEQVLSSTSDVLFPAEMGQKPVTIQSRDLDGDSPLHVIAWQRDTEGAKILIDAGADVNALGDMGYTPLHVAIATDNVELAEILKNAGARCDLVTEISGTAKEEAIRRGGKMGALFFDSEV